MLQSENLLVQCKRYGSKINIQRPRPPHYTRKLFNAVTEPIYPRRTAIDFCHEKQALHEQAKQNKKNVLHPYLAILARELSEFFHSAQMILICQRNSMTAFEYFNFKVAMHKKNIKTKIYGREIINGALENTKFSSMLPLLMQTPYNCMLLSDEWNVKDALNVLKKTPKVLLLAGTLGDRYLERDELENYANLPDLQVSRAQFVATMNSVGGQLTNHLQAHQSNFAYMLDAHADALKNGDAKTGTSTSASNENAPTPTSTDEKST